MTTWFSLQTIHQVLFPCSECLIDLEPVLRTFDEIAMLEAVILLKRSKVNSFCYSHDLIKSVGNFHLLKEVISSVISPQFPLSNLVSGWNISLYRAVLLSYSRNLIQVNISLPVTIWIRKYLQEWKESNCGADISKHTSESRKGKYFACYIQYVSILRD